MGWQHQIIHKCHINKFMEVWLDKKMSTKWTWTSKSSLRWLNHAKGSNNTCCYSGSSTWLCKFSAFLIGHFQIIWNNTYHLSRIWVMLFIWNTYYLSRGCVMKILQDKKCQKFQVLKSFDTYHARGSKYHSAR